MARAYSLVHYINTCAGYKLSVLHEGLILASTCLPILVPLGNYFWQGEPLLAVKIGPSGLILAAKISPRTSFGNLFCQNQSGGTILGGTNFGVIVIQYNYNDFKHFMAKSSTNLFYHICS